MEVQLFDLVNPSPGPRQPPAPPPRVQGVDQVWAPTRVDQLQLLEYRTVRVRRTELRRVDDKDLIPIL